VTAPLLSKVCIAAALLLSIGLAFFGPGPRRASRSTVRILAAVAAAWYLLAAYATFDDRGLVWIGALVAAGVETTCIAAWYARYRPEPEAGDSGPEEPPPPDHEDPYVPLWAGYREPSQGGSRLWSDS
jgi:hypothetical protein